MSKQFLAIIAAIIIGFVGIAVYNGNQSKKDGVSSSSKSSVSQHIAGNPNAKVTLLEYGDFQCPYCQQYAATVQQVQEQYKDTVKFQFRNFPLSSIHQNAVAAARAAEAASLQNKFWEMHDLLYSTGNWEVWTKSSDPTPLFTRYAEQLGLNPVKFKTDFSSVQVNDTINADKAAGTKLGIQGTPTFYVNGKEIKINNSVAGFQKELDAALKQN